MSGEEHQERSPEENLPPNPVLMYCAFGVILIWLGIHTPDFRMPEYGWVGHAVRIALFTIGGLCFIVGYLKYRQFKQAGQAGDSTGGPEAS